MRQVPSALGLTAGQNLLTAARLGSRQETVDTLALKGRGLVRVTSRLPALLQSVENAN